MFGGDFVAKGGKLGGGSGDEDEIVALFGKLERELLADAIAGAGDDGPGSWSTERTELESIRRSKRYADGIFGLTDFPGRTKMLKRTRTMLNR